MVLSVWAWQVRLSFLVPVRMLLAFSYSLCYRKLGLPYPWLQGTFVHAAGEPARLRMCMDVCFSLK